MTMKIVFPAGVYLYVYRYSTLFAFRKYSYNLANKKTNSARTL